MSGFEGQETLKGNSPTRPSPEAVLYLPHRDNRKGDQSRYIVRQQQSFKIGKKTNIGGPSDFVVYRLSLLTLTSTPPRVGFGTLV